MGAGAGKHKRNTRQNVKFPGFAASIKGKWKKTTLSLTIKQKNSGCGKLIKLTLKVMESLRMNNNIIHTETFHYFQSHIIMHLFREHHLVTKEHAIEHSNSGEGIEAFVGKTTRVYF